MANLIMLTLKSAIVFAVLGIIFMIKNPLHKRGYARAQGVITDYERGQKDGEDVFFAKVKFPCKEEEIIFTDNTPLRKKPTFGKIVDVLYDRENPQRAEIEGNLSILFPWIFILIAFIIQTLLFIIKDDRELKTKQADSAKQCPNPNKNKTPDFLKARVLK